ncbi:hypothetical protein POI8812_01041 [Pontivivens insulae]|uniref:Uncharacterized protein n=1 Tax=Pontivivens insulae TaxID=1639689 RepID=A0A2R8A9P2_9RHOB|nr:hypothetical protein DFR53_1040 [Pontivivens insulae]SPF28738.1 hypothetical protein POI8812_01041 [Pontivivens insulae]
MLAADGELSSQCVGVRNLEPVGGKRTFAVGARSASLLLSGRWLTAARTKLRESHAHGMNFQTLWGVFLLEAPHHADCKLLDVQTGP